MSLPWFRMYAEFATDPVVQAMSFEDQRHYIMILCLKCSGVLDRPISKKERARIIGKALGLEQKEVDNLRRRFARLQLCGPNLQPTAWSQRQYASDNSTERVRKWRKYNESGNVTPPSPKRFGNGPDTDTDLNPPLTPPLSPQRPAPTGSKRRGGESIHDRIRRLNQDPTD